MTSRERRLRTRIDTLTDERAELVATLERMQAQVVELQRYAQQKHGRWCIYCGVPYIGRDDACAACADLLLIDPYAPSYH